MPRGFVWAGYVSDDGNIYLLHVDADYAQVPERGWATLLPEGLPIYPRGWRARRVQGVDELGNIRVALVGNVFADLWTGVATTFVVQASDQTDVVCTTIATIQERMKPAPP